MQRPQTRTSWTTPLLTRRCRTADKSRPIVHRCFRAAPAGRVSAQRVSAASVSSRGRAATPHATGTATPPHVRGTHDAERPFGYASLLHALRRTHRLVCSSCDRGLIPVGVKLHCRRLKDGGILVAYLLGRRCTRIDHQPQTTRDSSAHNQSYLEGGDCEIRTLSLKSCVHCT